MNYFLKIGLVFLISGFSTLTQAQEFSSFEKISEELYKVELVFKEINSFQTAEKIISSLRELKGVKDVELFLKEAKPKKLSTDALEGIQKILARAMKKGFSDDDYCSLSEVINPR